MWSHLGERCLSPAAACGYHLWGQRRWGQLRGLPTSLGSESRSRVTDRGAQKSGVEVKAARLHQGWALGLKSSPTLDQG